MVGSTPMLNVLSMSESAGPPSSLISWNTLAAMATAAPGDGRPAPAPGPYRLPEDVSSRNDGVPCWRQAGGVPESLLLELLEEPVPILMSKGPPGPCSSGHPGIRVCQLGRIGHALGRDGTAGNAGDGLSVLANRWRFGHYHVKPFARMWWPRRDHHAHSVAFRYPASIGRQGQGLAAGQGRVGQGISP